MKRFLLFGSLLVSAVLYSQNFAVLIIDMQDYFVTRYNNQDRWGNQAKLRRVLDEQILLMQFARQNSLPIILIDYEDDGPVNQEIMEEYNKAILKKQITKSTNDLFSRFNETKDEVLCYLDQNNISHLIVAGANGNACVNGTINGAITHGYNIWALNTAIADFNYKYFAYPIYYGDLKDQNDTGREIYEHDFEIENREMFSQFDHIENLKHSVHSCEAKNEAHPKPSMLEQLLWAYLNFAQTH